MKNKSLSKALSKALSKSERITVAEIARISLNSAKKRREWEFILDEADLDEIHRKLEGFLNPKE